MQLSRHFSLAEFTVSTTAKKAGVENTPTTEHLRNLFHTAQRMEVVRDILGGPIVPTSVYRNPQVNKLVGGVAGSDHALGFAVDFQQGSNPNSCLVMAQKLAKELDSFDQIILERNGTVIHISFNPRNRRQTLTQRGGPGTPFISGLKA